MRKTLLSLLLVQSLWAADIILDQELQLQSSKADSSVSPHHPNLPAHDPTIGVDESQVSLYSEKGNNRAIEGKGIFKDPRDLQEYNWIKIGDKKMMLQNLNFQTNNSFCVSQLGSTCQKSGRLYPWEMIQIACPKGWHIPTDVEWQYLDIQLKRKSLQDSVSVYGSRFEDPILTPFWSASGTQNLYVWHQGLRLTNDECGRSHCSRFNANAVRCIQEFKD